MLLCQNRFPNFCTARKRIKFATKPTQYYPPTLGMLIHYLGKLKSQLLQIFSRYGRKMQTNFDIFEIKIASVFKYWLQIKFSMSLFFNLIIFAISLWHQKFVTADVTGVFINNQRGIQRREEDFAKKFVFEEVHSKEGMVLISCWKNYGTQAQSIQPQNAHTTTGSFQIHPHFTPSYA